MACCAGRRTFVGATQSPERRRSVDSASVRTRPDPRAARPRRGSRGFNACRGQGPQRHLLVARRAPRRAQGGGRLCAGDGGGAAHARTCIRLRTGSRGNPNGPIFPFVLLTLRGGGIERNPRALRYLQALGNAAILERPFHPTSLVSLVKSAIRGRRRQYEARARLEILAELNATLEAAWTRRSPSTRCWRTSSNPPTRSCRWSIPFPVHRHQPRERERVQAHLRDPPESRRFPARVAEAHAGTAGHREGGLVARPGGRAVHRDPESSAIPSVPSAITR